MIFLAIPLGVLLWLTGLIDGWLFAGIVIAASGIDLVWARVRGEIIARRVLTKDERREFKNLMKFAKTHKAEARAELIRRLNELDERDEQ